jgi:hypothetical protein
MTQYRRVARASVLCRAHLVIFRPVRELFVGDVLQPLKNGGGQGSGDQRLVRVAARWLP